jgi:hypothetical protein
MAKEGLQAKVGLIVKQANLVDVNQDLIVKDRIQHVDQPRHNAHQQLKRKQEQHVLVGKRKRMVAL